MQGLDDTRFRRPACVAKSVVRGDHIVGVFVYPKRPSPLNRPNALLSIFLGVGVCGRIDFVRARVRDLVLAAIDAAKRVTVVVRDRMFRAGAVMSTGAVHLCIAWIALLLESF